MVSCIPNTYLTFLSSGLNSHEIPLIFLRSKHPLRRFCSFSLRVRRFQQRLPCDLNLISRAQSVRGSGHVVWFAAHSRMLDVDQDLEVMDG
jgi:hypothetical protein